MESPKYQTDMEEFDHVMKLEKCFCSAEKCHV